MSPNDIKLEVCVDSIASAIAAAEGGAARIELCSALAEGGLTPTVGTLKALKCLPLSIPIFCMLRPRRGNDFVYTQEEMNAVLYDMQILRENGADGFVFGALTPARELDLNKCQEVASKAADLPVTFHRAFDLTEQSLMHTNVERIKHMGYKRLLSSGFRQTADTAVDTLAQLVAKHHRDFIVMPGGGINIDNLDELLTITKCQEFHSSAKKAPPPTDAQRMECDVYMGKQDFAPYDIASIDVIRKMVSIAQGMSTGT